MENIERLRASREQLKQKVRAAGFEAGKAWALENAEWENILAVAALDPEHETVNGLYDLLSDRGEDDETFAAMFGYERHQFNLISDEAAQGFVEGVKLVHDQVGKDSD